LADGSESTLTGSDIREIAYDPSGDKVAFVRQVQTTIEEGGSSRQVEAVELFVAPANDLAAARQITEFGSIISGPTWAPNGIQLAFVSDFDGDEDIWTITDDGLNSRKLTENESSDRDPAWSPDGEQIVFISDIESPGITKLFSMTSEGADMRRLNDLSGNTYNPRWSHDGLRLTFVNDSTGDGDIYIADADGQRSLLLTADDGGAEDREPAFTPDGRWVGFASNRDGENFQLYLMDLRGDVLTRLTQSDRDDQNLDFRPELILRLR
jgi:TolB protein